MEFLCAGIGNFFKQAICKAVLGSVVATACGAVRCRHGAARCRLQNLQSPAHRTDVGGARWGERRGWPYEARGASSRVRDGVEAGVFGLISVLHTQFSD